jgi:hypothetical protein
MTDPMNLTYEQLHTLATMPPIDTIDWKAEYAKLYAAFREAGTALDAAEAALATRPTLEQTATDLCRDLAALTNDSVCFRLSLWDHGNMENHRSEVEYQLYSCRTGQSYRGGSLAEAGAGFREAWEHWNRPAEPAPKQSEGEVQL